MFVSLVSDIINCKLSAVVDQVQSSRFGLAEVGGGVGGVGQGEEGLGAAGVSATIGACTVRPPLPGRPTHNSLRNRCSSPYASSHALTPAPSTPDFEEKIALFLYLNVFSESSIYSMKQSACHELIGILLSKHRIKVRNNGLNQSLSQT